MYIKVVFTSRGRSAFPFHYFFSITFCLESVRAKGQPPPQPLNTCNKFLSRHEKVLAERKSTFTEKPFLHKQRAINLCLSRCY
ncbi:hypothetical protein XELAEV_18028405mg [Xenopus laevis]|uniref:Uncharacterized protein n=1 Tax=Xenopus laevis TaxID=8355 RepID=A0A974CZP4_XENLA|nr:hypothetical protein XELAEV_18028405mg [Xenopus laevis]